MAERTEANLRWANNALTTNGEMHSRTLTVTATAEVEGGTAAGTVSQEIAGADEVAAVVAAAEQLARTGRPAEDAMPLVENYAHGDDWTAEPETTDIDVLGDVAKGLGEAFAQAAANRQLLFGFAEHVVTTTYLGSSTGLRRRGVQPTGRLELNAKTADRIGVGLGRPGHPDLRRRGHRRRVRRGQHPAGLGQGADRAAAGGVRGPAAARAGRRPADLHCTGRPTPATPRRAATSSPPAKAGPGSARRWPRCR